MGQMHLLPHADPLLPSFIVACHDTRSVQGPRLARRPHTVCAASLADCRMRPRIRRLLSRLRYCNSGDSLAGCSAGNSMVSLSHPRQRARTVSECTRLAELYGVSTRRKWWSAGVALTSLEGRIHR